MPSSTVGEALWHLMGSNVDDLPTAIGLDPNMPLDEFRRRLSTPVEVWVYISYADGYPTAPLAVYRTPEDAQSALGGGWTFLPNGYNRGCYKTTTADGVAADLIRHEVQS